MDSSPQNSSRKKFLLWSAAILASASILKFIKGPKKQEEEKIKMLTQDGQLVEIDKKLLANTGKKISNQELQNWIKK